MNLSNFVDLLLAASNSIALCGRVRGHSSSAAIFKFIQIILIPFGLVKMLVLRCRYAIGGATTPSDIKLAVCCIVKDEAPYMREFIDFHLKQGVTRFFIYDNDSSDDISDLLKPYIDNGVVEYRIISGKARQLDAYNDAIRRHRNDGYLIAVIDADEFLVPADCDSTVLDELRALARACPPAGAFGINWKIFGSSGYRAKSECSSPYVTKSFLRRADDDFETNRHVKSIVDPRAVLAFLNPHAPVLLPGAHEHSNSGEQISGPYCNQSYRFVSLHHYFCKSYEEFCIKRGRGKADLLETRPFEDFDRHDKNDVYDDSAATVL